MEAQDYKSKCERLQIAESQDLKATNSWFLIETQDHKLKCEGLQIAEFTRKSVHLQGSIKYYFKK